MTVVSGQNLHVLGIRTRQGAGSEITIMIMDSSYSAQATCRTKTEYAALHTIYAYVQSEIMKVRLYYKESQNSV